MTANQFIFPQNRQDKVPRKAQAGQHSYFL